MPQDGEQGDRRAKANVCTQNTCIFERVYEYANLLWVWALHLQVAIPHTVHRCMCTYIHTPLSLVQALPSPGPALGTALQRVTLGT